MNTTAKVATAGVAVVALMAGSYAAGRFFAPQQVVAEEAAPVAQRPAVVPGNGDALALSKALSEVEALKVEKAALQKALAEAKAAGEEAAKAAVEPPKRLSMRERMEELKKQDPERYRQMEERRAQFQQALQDAREKRDDFLGSVDLALFTPEERLVHEQFTAALAKQAEMEERMRELFESGEMPSEEQRAAMRETQHTLRDLREAERSALLGAVATSMGLSESDSADFAQLMTEIYDATSNGMRMRPGRGDAGGPGGPDGPGGGPGGMPPPGP
ncbi:MAG: hypothetical protein ACI4W7_00685 [Candidatus Spyradenecus sp.]